MLRILVVSKPELILTKLFMKWCFAGWVKVYDYAVALINGVYGNTKHWLLDLLWLN